MTTLEKRLFHLFDPGERRKARSIVPATVTCPRVGQVQATLSNEDGTTHEVLLELSAGRRGGMILESRCTSPRGKAGQPCALVAAVLLEIDRRGLFSGLHDHTPVTLDVVAGEAEEDEEDAFAGLSQGDDAPDPMAEAAGGTEPVVQAVALRPGVTEKRRSREPAWAVELEERRRLVEPAVRGRSLPIPGHRRSAFAVVFLLDLTAAVESRLIMLTPCEMQLDHAGEAMGRPRPITIGPAGIPLASLDPEEQALLSELAGTEPGSGTGGATLLEHRPVACISISPEAAARHLSRLCELGRLVIQPEPRRAPDLVIPLVWDAGRPWEFALVVEPDDDRRVAACVEADLAAQGGEKTLPRPAKATLRGALVRGSERRDLRDPRALLKAGFVIFGDRLASVALGNQNGESAQPPAADDDAVRPLVRWMEQFERRGPIELAGNQVDGLIERLVGLAFVPRLELPGWTGWQVESGTPRPKLVLDDTPAVARDGDESAVARPGGRGRGRRAAPKVHLTGTIWFDYGGILIAADDPAGGAVDTNRRRCVRRNLRAEQALMALLPRHGFIPPRPDQAATEAPLHHVEVPRPRLDGAVSQLAAGGWTVEVSGRRYRPAGSVAWNVTSGIDWFELTGSVDFGGQTADMPALLAALARGDRHVELDDGSIGILPDDFGERLEPMTLLAEKRDGRLRYTRVQAALLDALLAGQPQARVDEAFEAVREALATGDRPEPEPEPEGFRGTLRLYQREGLGWLSFLERTGLGGCLADDMGLGKTIQVLALLVRRQVTRREAGLLPRPSLVVVPKSLIFNWTEEAHRFAPELRVVNLTGSDRADVATLDAGDLVLTTYGTLRRDILQHRDVEYDYVVLDEAQSIKNAASQAAKACRLLRARHRLAVTGTPVENHIGELWSIFEFLNPGQLGSATRLKRFLGSGRGSAAELVARAVRPYILRRTKAEVLADLPEKTEQTLFCELGTEQRRAYDELRDHYRAELTGRIGRMGLGRSRIAVLEALLRLRQAACHPGLVDPARIDEPAAKLETLLEQLSEVLDEGHKVLVFSQFTSFLAILRRQLDARGVVYEYLDGRTTDRQSRVERFQQDPDCRLFLVSLKAGGQGLNLTAADYVYILDPWWNPAVEAQAVDRAHRIGQTRRVFAYRLIARDTVEEKILALQDQKRELAESIVSADAGVLASLTAADVELLLS